MTDDAVTQSEEETQSFAAGIAEELAPGAVILLSGDLGAGKTVFVRGLAAGLGIDPGEVSSPTFTLVHEYRGGRLTLFHADLYRLTRTGTEDLGLEEPAVAKGVLAIEWPERLAHAIPGAMKVRMEVAGESSRRITVEPAHSIR
jgi:tRNA threonylcarbamoyladenosine biosynthesis protein TsaE